MLKLFGIVEGPVVVKLRELIALQGRVLELWGHQPEWRRSRGRPGDVALTAPSGLSERASPSAKTAYPSLIAVAW